MARLGQTPMNGGFPSIKSAGGGLHAEDPLKARDLVTCICAVKENPASFDGSILIFLRISQSQLSSNAFQEAIT